MPHLHFAPIRLDEDRRCWKGRRGSVAGGGGRAFAHGAEEAAAALAANFASTEDV